MNKPDTTRIIPAIFLIRTKTPNWTMIMNIPKPINPRETINKPIPFSEEIFDLYNKLPNKKNPTARIIATKNSNII